MVSRIATFPATDALVRANVRTQSAVSDIQLQISSGLKSPDYKGIARDTQRLLNLETSRNKLETFSTNGKLVTGNVELAFSAIERMNDLANNMLSGLTAALGGDFVNPAVTTSQGQIGLDEFVGLLNVQSAGRYIFGGSRIDTPPVDINDPSWTAQTPPSVANTGYYQGDSTINSVQMGDSLYVNYGVLASDPAFEQALRAYNLIINNPGNQAAYREASGLLQSAIDGMANVRGQVGTNARTIENAILRNDEDKATLTEMISSIKEVDLAQASVDLQEAQTQLEASYATTVRLLQLSLFDFLR
jgi:flagellar hook-associated protein 3 FlgL